MRKVEVDALDMLVPGSDHLQGIARAAANINKLPNIIESSEILEHLGDQYHRVLSHGVVEHRAQPLVLPQVVEERHPLGPLER